MMIITYVSERILQSHKNVIGHKSVNQKHFLISSRICEVARTLQRTTNTDDKVLSMSTHGDTKKEPNK